MSADDEPTDLPTGQSRARRPSFADMFGNRRPSFEASKNSRSSISSAMAQAQEQSRQRRLSITTLGLSPSSVPPAQSSPFSSLANKGRSQSEAVPRSTSDLDEQAIDDTESSPPLSGDNSLARRMSISAKAYTTMRAGNSAFGGRSPSGSDSSSPASSASSYRPSSPPVSKAKEGFNWSENLRSRAERSSISAAAIGSGSILGNGVGHRRNPSGGLGDAVAPVTPTRTPQKAPDHFQERILKGDFYMD